MNGVGLAQSSSLAAEDVNQCTGLVQTQVNVIAHSLSMCHCFSASAMYGRTL